MPQPRSRHAIRSHLWLAVPAVAAFFLACQITSPTAAPPTLVPPAATLIAPALATPGFAAPTPTAPVDQLAATAVTPSPSPGESGVENERRSATLSELVNDVDAQPSAAAEWHDATSGEVLNVGASARTMAASRARVDFTEGTIVRLAEHTTLRVAELNDSLTDPITRLTLLLGELYVELTTSLGGGSFEVETPVGVAAVQGSYMSVAYDAAADSIRVTCLEGACRVRNALAEIELFGGEALDLRRGEFPGLPRAIAEEELERWRFISPEGARPHVERIERERPTPHIPSFWATRRAAGTPLPTRETRTPLPTLAPRTPLPTLLPTLEPRTPIIAVTPLLDRTPILDVTLPPLLDRTPVRP